MTQSSGSGISRLRLVLGLAGVLLVLVAGAWVVYVRGGNGSYSCKGCNVVIIDIDHVRPDGLPCYGYSKNTAPNICSLSGRSVQFDSHFSHSHWTLPSIASLFTSVYPAMHGVYVVGDTIPRGIPTLPELFKKAGYTTAFIGPEINREYGKFSGDTSYLPVGYRRGMDMVTNDGIDAWPDVIRSLRAKDEPFFAFFYAGDLHIPYTVPDGAALFDGSPRLPGVVDTKAEVRALMEPYVVERYREIFSKKSMEARPELFVDPARNPKEVYDYYATLEYPTEIYTPWYSIRYQTIMKYLKNNANGNPTYARNLRSVYDTVLSQVDTRLGPVLRELTDGASGRDTVLVFMSDHGDEFNEHGGYAHTTLYREVVQAPLFIRVPGGKPRRVGGLTEIIDIFPTLTEITGIPVERAVQGMSLTGLMKGAGTSDGWVISEVDRDHAAVRNADWMLLARGYRSSEPTLELYNRKIDPAEAANVVSTYPEEAQTMLTSLREIMARGERLYSASPDVVPTWPDDEIRKRLIREGYF